MRGVAAALRRRFDFARHIPLQRMLRRLDLALRRRWPAALKHRAPVNATAVAEPPQPLFPMREGAAWLTPDGWRFRFLNVAADLGRPVDWRAGGEASRQLWRMNLHYMEYLEGCDDAAFADLVADWLSANSVERLGAWRDAYTAYAVSIRTVVWMQQLARRGARLAPALRSAMQESLKIQLAWLATRFETDLGGNHLVKNIKAMAWGAAFFEGPAADDWRRRSKRLLPRALRQVMPDGVHEERSASYHAQVFADLLEVRLACGGDPCGGALDAALARMAQATADLSHPDGGPALFNDAGLHMAYAPEICLGAYESLCGRRPVPREAFAFKEVGYYGLRTVRTCLIVDCGRIGPDDLPAHAHADVLSLEWSVDGHRLIVDPGVYEYVAGPRRDMARSTAAHNTLSLAGVDQAEPFGAFRCGRRPNVTLRALDLTGGFVLEGAHDGFAHLPGRPVHVRRVVVDATTLKIEDRIEGWTDRAASVGFLLHPDWRVELDGQTARLSCGASEVDAVSKHGVWLREPAVWWPDMGVELETVRLHLTLPAGAGLVTTWRLRS